MENEVENTRHHTRAHPYKSPFKSPSNSSSSSSTSTGLKITHNFFSFANNTTSLFPQPQSQQLQRQPLRTLKTVNGPPCSNSNSSTKTKFTSSSSSSSSSLTSTVTSSTSTTDQSKRQPFQELNSNGTAFLKIPSSFKLTESSLTLLPQQELQEHSANRHYEQNEEEEEEKSSDVEMSIVISPHPIQQKQLTVQLQERSQTPPQYPDYCVDILNNWNNSQYRSRPRKYMDKQKDISFRMRSILIDWLVEVALEFDTLHETLFLSTSIIDRFLSRMSVPKSKLQLIGTASFFIACKYEEVQPPGIKDFVYITDDTYTTEQIIRMEQIILQALDFDLMPPTSYTFTKAYTRLLQLTPQETSLAFYLTELSMIDGERYTTILPSLIATGAVALARHTYSDVFWDSALCLLTIHTKNEAQRCAQYLYNTFYEASTWSQSAVFDKYKAAKYCSVSTSLPKLPWP